MPPHRNQEMFVGRIVLSRLIMEEPELARSYDAERHISRYEAASGAE